jgi:hypothetical protein
VAISFPTSLDNFTNPSSGNTLDSPSHSLQHSDINDAVEALEAKLGIGASPAGSASAGDVLTISSAGSSAWTAAGVAFKNLVINGDMQVNQRGTSVASNTAGGYLTADRFTNQLSSLGTWTQSVENDAPTGSGFRKSLKMLCTTADASPAAGDYNLISQFIEGQNLQQVLKGTSSAKPLTVSFWIKSNVTGTYIAELQDVDNTRQVSATYTVSASATWERKTITFPADTTGAFDNDNGLSLAVNFWLGAGSTFTSGTLNTVWASQTNANRVVGQTNVASAINNYWQITGLQVELGSAATGFEFLPAQTELALCQRYYFRNSGSTSNNYVRVAQGHVGQGTSTALYAHTYMPVTLRANPSSIEFSNLGAWNGGNPIAISAVVLESCSPSVVTLLYTSSGLTQNTVYGVIGNNNASAYLGINSEL